MDERGVPFTIALHPPGLFDIVPALSKSQLLTLSIYPNLGSKDFQKFLQIPKGLFHLPVCKPFVTQFEKVEIVNVI